MPKLTYLHLRKGGDVSFAFGNDEWRVSVTDHGEHSKDIYATLLAAYLSQTSISVKPIGTTKKVSDVWFGSDPS